jgi:hypothetical protein
MELARARQVVETTSPETVNQYLRFGWKLVNQCVLEPRDGLPARVNYILASFRALEDTRQLVTLDDVQQVNQYLALGWRLIDKTVTQGNLEGPRHEQIQFVLAWTNDEPPRLPGMGDVQHRPVDPTIFDDLGDFSNLPPMDENEMGMGGAG